MKTFETPVIEVIAFTVADIVSTSVTEPSDPPELPTNNNRLPWI